MESRDGYTVAQVPVLQLYTRRFVIMRPVFLYDVDQQHSDVLCPATCLGARRWQSYSEHR